MIIFFILSITFIFCQPNPSTFACLECNLNSSIYSRSLGKTGSSFIITNPSSSQINPANQELKLYDLGFLVNNYNHLFDFQFKNYQVFYNLPFDLNKLNFLYFLNHKD